MAHKSLGKILSNALSKVKPSPKELEEDRAAAEKLMRLFRKSLPKEIGLELVGSVAKGTHLRGDMDLDIFMLFPKTKYSRKDLKTLGLSYAKKAIPKKAKWQVGYAEHPYLKTRINGYDVELVPSFKIFSASELGSAADRSPLHTQYVLKRMTQKQKDEVRLLKKFLKRLAVYGAEVKVEGFSGYLCELLVLRYGSFTKLLETASEWVDPVVDLESEYANPSKARERFGFPPIVVVDPVDKNRNVAAAVSQTSLSKFIIAARSFLRNPSKEFFFETPPKITSKHLREMKHMLLDRDTPHVFVMRFPAPEVVPDILWPQLRRTARIIFERLEKNGFEVFDYTYWTDEQKYCVMVFELVIISLPRIEKVAGPEVQYIGGVADFIKKHRNPLAGPWIGGNRVYSAKKRRFTQAIDVVDHIVSNPTEYAIPKKIAPVIKKYKRMRTPSLLGPKYQRFMFDYLYKKHYYIESY